MRKSYFYATLTVLTLGVLAGCGGGGGSNDDNGDGGIPATARLKAYSPATFIYDLTGNLSTDGGTTTRPLASGSLRNMRVEAGASANAFTLTATDIYGTASGSVPEGLRTEIVQQTDRSAVATFVQQADNENVSGGTTTNSGVVLVPGTFAIDSSLGAQTLQFSSAPTSATYTFNIGARARRTLSDANGVAQAYNTYVVTSALTFADNDKRTGTYYYVPELGTYVEADETVTRPNGTVARIHATLRLQQ